MTVPTWQERSAWSVVAKKSIYVGTDSDAGWVDCDDSAPALVTPSRTELEYHLMFTTLTDRLAAPIRHATQTLRQHLLALTRPAPATLASAALTDAMRSKPALIAENALLRQQVLILHRSVKRPRCTPTERTVLVLLASRLPTWRHALLIVRPETLRRWHRELFRLWWRRKTRATPPAHRPALAAETIALIREMAAANRLWGAERIRGELLKLDIRVAKSTIQKYMRDTRPPRRTGQMWACHGSRRHP
jgi:hypothetical protein